jgi:hypothetical protein
MLENQCSGRFPKRAPWEPILATPAYLLGAGSTPDLLDYRKPAHQPPFEGPALTPRPVLNFLPNASELANLGLALLRVR